MSELDTNGFFEALQKERDKKNAERILKESRQREDQWWELYKKGLVKYENH